MKKKVIITTITEVLMMLIEALALFLLYRKLQGESYVFIGVEFKKIIIGELLLLIVSEILIIKALFIKKKSDYVLSNTLTGILMIVTFLLIAFKYYSYGNFINTCIVFVYTLMMKKQIKEK